VEEQSGKGGGFGRVLWSVLAVIALVAVAGGVLYVDNGGDDHSGQGGDGSSETPGTSTDEVASSGTLATITGTFYYIEYGDDGSELWSWKPGQQPKSEYKSKNRLVSDASVSPDGRYLAFLVAGSEYPKNNLVVRDLKNKTDRTIAKDLVQGGEYCMDALWAPDGRPMILTQTRINTAGLPVLRWFDTEAGTKSREIPVHGCFARPVARGDDGYDLYYTDVDDEDFTREVFKQTPDGTATPTGLGPAVEDSLGEPLLGLGSVSAGAKQACVLVGNPSGPTGRILNCKTVLDVNAKTVVYSPDGGFKGPVLFLGGGQILGRFSGFVTLMAADGTELARANEPTTVKAFHMLTYVP